MFDRPCCFQCLARHKLTHPLKNTQIDTVVPPSCARAHTHKPSLRACLEAMTDVLAVWEENSLNSVFVGYILLTDLLSSIPLLFLSNVSYFNLPNWYLLTWIHLSIHIQTTHITCILSISMYA